MNRFLSPLIVLTLLTACDQKKESPVSPPAAAKAPKSSASFAIQVLLNAIQQYEVDYDQMPLPTSATKGIDCWTVTQAEEFLPTILKGLDKEQNPKGTDYLEGLPRAVLNGERVINGWYPDTPEMLAIYDPWGSCYWVEMDFDGDGQLEDPDLRSEPETKGGKQPKIQKRLLIWSGGPDRDGNTWEDNICSWK